MSRVEPRPQSRRRGFRVSIEWHEVLQGMLVDYMPIDHQLARHPHLLARLHQRWILVACRRRDPGLRVCAAAIVRIGPAIIVPVGTCGPRARRCVRVGAGVAVAVCGSVAHVAMPVAVAGVKRAVAGIAVASIAGAGITVPLAVSAIACNRRKPRIAGPVGADVRAEQRGGERLDRILRDGPRPLGGAPRLRVATVSNLRERRDEVGVGVGRLRLARQVGKRKPQRPPQEIGAAACPVVSWRVSCCADCYLRGAASERST